MSSDRIAPRSTVGWDDIPTEIFLYIFKKMDITSLRCCFSVCKKWREIAICVCDLQDLWQALAEDGMVNHGVTQRQKSILNWKDLYFNSFLWKCLPSVATHKIEHVKKKDIINLHVYNDKLIVVNPYGFEYCDIETLQSLRITLKENCVDVQESDQILMVVTGNDASNYNNVTVFIKLHKDEEIDPHNFLIEATHSFVNSRCWRFVGDRVYVIDSKSCLWECAAVNGSLSVKALARFYGDYQLTKRSSLNSIHVIKEDIYVSLAWGDLLICAKNSRMFRKVNASEIPTKLIVSSKDSLYKFNALIKYPFNMEFVHENEAPQNMIHYHYDDPEMTAGLQHGDVVFRGFEYGGIEIHVLRDGFKHNFNVQQLDHDVVSDLTVTALEISELKDMHKIFIATSSKLYSILLKYPEEGLET